SSSITLSRSVTPPTHPSSPQRSNGSPAAPGAHILAAIAQMERSLLIERVQSGLARHQGTC
ncbi:MAG TPA: hypothetical protein VNB91_10300, partial [Jatrophihabitantaceae bacterium]|nr:hypothetical protein [Jatrophihabitantaceae bacterium]